MRRIGMSEIAKVARVSIGTVGRALNNQGRINEETRQRVLQIARDLGYKPNLAARALSVGKGFRIGVCIPKELRFFYDQVRAGIFDEARRHEHLGLEVVYRPVDRLGSGEAEKIRELLGENIKALIITPGVPKKLTALINEAQQKGIHVVCVNTDAPGSNRSSVVSMDPELAGRVAGELMGRLVPAKSQVAIVTGMLHTDIHYKTVRGFSDMLPRICRGGAVAEVLEGHEDEDETFAKCMTLLRQSRKLAGIYVNTVNCLPVCRALSSTGRSGKVTLITTDLFQEMVRYFEEGTIVASIHQRPYFQGQTAVRMVMDHLVSGHPFPPTFYLTPHVVLRSNVAGFREVRGSEPSEAMFSF
jgi:LacI family transcriptional regulator